MCINIYLSIFISVVCSATFFVIGFFFYEYNFFKIDKVGRNRKKLNKMLENKQNNPHEIMAAIRFIRENKN
jgi:hypothetical protein